jgi:hypothetical protein
MYNLCFQNIEIVFLVWLCEIKNCSWRTMSIDWQGCTIWPCGPRKESLIMIRASAFMFCRVLRNCSAICEWACGNDNWRCCLCEYFTDESRYIIKFRDSNAYRCYLLDIRIRSTPIHTGTLWRALQ